MATGSVLSPRHRRAIPTRTSCTQTPGTAAMATARTVETDHVDTTIAPVPVSIAEEVLHDMKVKELQHKLKHRGGNNFPAFMDTNDITIINGEVAWDGAFPSSNSRGN